MIDLTLIKQALEPVLSRFPVAFVYLYGSQMRGQTHAESDVDIALGFAANLKKDHDDLILDIYPELTRALKIPVEKKVICGDLKSFAISMRKDMQMIIISTVWPSIISSMRWKQHWIFAASW